MEVPLLEVRDLHVAVEDGEILHGVDLALAQGELAVIMGPNGSGKSTLANALLGNPALKITSGAILLNGEDVTYWAADARAKAGMFLAFQYPEEVPGVPMIQLLRRALSARRGIDMSMLELRVTMMEWLERLGMDASFATRYLNEGFSGGEKKRSEVLQMAVLQPDLAILDETDSGLDVDALRLVARGIGEVRLARPAMGALLVTHYQKVLEVLPPDRVHLLINGRIVESGGPDLARRLEAKGYQEWQQ